MFALIFEYGMDTRSWYAWLALRRRVNMSAIGSVMVMMRSYLSRRGSRARAYGEESLPGSLRHAGELATVGHLPDAHTAQSELAVHRLGAAAPLAAGVRANRELRLRGRLDDQRLLCHQFSLNGKPRSLSSARPSSSVFAVVTTVMSMPRVRSIRSWSISWNTDCSVRPNV